MAPLPISPLLDIWVKFLVFEGTGFSIRFDSIRLAWRDQGTVRKLGTPLFTKSQSRERLPQRESPGVMRETAENRGSRKEEKGRSLLLNLRYVIPLRRVPRSNADPSSSYDWPLLCSFNWPFFPRDRRESQRSEREQRANNELHLVDQRKVTVEYGSSFFRTLNRP